MGEGSHKALKRTANHFLVALMAAAAVVYSPSRLGIAGETSPGATDETAPHVALPSEPELSDYLDYALRNSPGLEAAWSRWRAAVERASAADSLPDPRFTYRYYIENIETRVGPQRQAFELAQTFPWFGKRGGRFDTAAASADAARERYEAEKLRLLYEVKTAYYDYYYLGRELAVARGNFEIMKGLEESLRKSYESGVAQYADVVKAQVELGRLDDRIIGLMAKRTPAVALLDASLNRPPGEPLPWPRSVPASDFDVSRKAVLNAVMTSSPELKELDREILATSHAVRLAAKDYFPDVTVGVSYIDTGSAVMPNVKDSGQDAVIAMVSVNVPLWRSRVRALEAEARARHRGAVYGRAERENALAAKVEMALYRFDEASRRVRLYRDALMPKARQAFLAADAALKAGKADFADVVEAQRMLLDFELIYEKGVVERARSLAEIEMLTGGEIPEDLHDATEHMGDRDGPG